MRTNTGRSALGFYLEDTHMKKLLLGLAVLSTVSLSLNAEVFASNNLEAAASQHKAAIIQHKAAAIALEAVAKGQDSVAAVAKPMLGDWFHWDTNPVDNL